MNLTADDVLTTTRSVRKRLDLERPVEREVIEEKKKVIADYYGQNYDAYTSRAEQPTYPDGDPRTGQRPKILDSSTYLRQDFHEVPVLLIPCLQGSGRRSPTPRGPTSKWPSGYQRPR